MKYQIEAVSIVEKEEPVDITLLKMTLTTRIEKDVMIFHILGTKIYNKSFFIQYMNPFNAVREIRMVLDRNQRIQGVVNYKVVREKTEKYYTEMADKMKKANIKFEKKELIDTLPLARKAFTGPENHKLTTLIEYLRIDVNDSHRALEDAKATSFVYTTAINILYDK